MMNQIKPNRIFNLNVAFKGPLQNNLFSLFKGSIEQVLGLPRLNRFYDDVSRMQDNRLFPDKVLDRLGISYDISDADLSRTMIPKGPVIVVANHPFGGTGFVKPKKPIHAKSLKGWDIDAVVRLLKDDVENLSELISCVESDGKGVPILLKQYLKLGGEIAGFNIDTAFGDVIDGLIIVDLTKTEPRMLDRYLGKDGTRMFLAHHEAMNRDRLVA